MTVISKKKAVTFMHKEHRTSKVGDSFTIYPVGGGGAEHKVTVIKTNMDSDCKVPLWISLISRRGVVGMY